MRIGVRWTVGDVSSHGYETLALSIAGATKTFGPDARYVVCVNSVGVETARQRVGPVSDSVEWVDATSLVPAWLAKYAGPGMAEGVAWKFAPVELFADGPSLALDNDVILWSVPDSVRQWYEDGDSFLIAEDVSAHHGQFAAWCAAEPRNSGIRGVPGGFDVDRAIRDLLDRSGVILESETDEQGLQAALVTSRKHRLVRLDEVTICGYFRPHRLELGSCGAHFVGVNSRHLPWEWQGRNGVEWIHSFWQYMEPQVHARISADVADTMLRNA